MKERPILFSGPMVRALLAGTKTQTRRICKPAATLSAVVAVQDPDQQPFGQRPPYLTPGWFGDEDGELQFFSPYGAPGDRLWVRETHAPQADCWAAWENWLRGDGGPAPIIHYAADFWPFQDGQGFMVRKPFIEKWRPSIHMPRWASRITLEVTGVRVERLQDISEDDARAEGAKFELVPQDSVRLGATASYRGGFIRLWESINGAGTWNVNPWVWCISFRRVAP